LRQPPTTTLFPYTTLFRSRLDLEQLKQKEFAKRTRQLIWLESSVILGLLVWVSLEYENNPFMQSWEKTNIGPVSFLLNGTLAGLDRKSTRLNSSHVSISYA